MSHCCKTALRCYGKSSYRNSRVYIHNLLLHLATSPCARGCRWYNFGQSYCLRKQMPNISNQHASFVFSLPTINLFKLIGTLWLVAVTFQRFEEKFNDLQSHPSIFWRDFVPFDRFCSLPIVYQKAGVCVLLGGMPSRIVMSNTQIGMFFFFIWLLAIYFIHHLDMESRKN